MDLISGNGAKADAEKAKGKGAQSAAPAKGGKK